MRFSLCINHTPWIPARVAALREMMVELDPLPPESTLFINDKDYRGTDWQVSKVDWALTQWRWSATQDVDRHMFMTDDLNLCPSFWKIVQAMHVHAGDAPIGFLSNHPKAPSTPAHWYRSASWLVGPCYSLSHPFLLRYLQWFESLVDGPHTVPGTKAWANDDSSINEFVHRTGGYSLHPLPTPIEHRGDIGSTVNHGDRHSRERVSWRAERWVEDQGEHFVWRERELSYDIHTLCEPSYWANADKSPLLRFP